MSATISAAAAAATADPFDRVNALAVIAGNELESPLERLWAADRLVEAAADLRAEAVAAARSEGATWASIGDVLGTSRQAAGMRFHWVK